ncbi:hypothetical protein HPHPH11_1111 [Helicobacter pylori Hp H-11]|nr:hypothetical protein HPHPH11_1111 [Helicobacter pylori Hp H-11]
MGCDGFKKYNCGGECVSKLTPNKGLAFKINSANANKKTLAF